MKNKLIIIISVLGLVSIAIYLSKDNSKSIKELVAINVPNESPKYKHWLISKLSDSLLNLKSNELTFMNENSMKGIYIELKKGESFKRKAETDDIYYLYSGSCSVHLSNENQSFDKGDAIFVKKGSDFNIDNSEESLQIIMTSMKLPSNSKTYNWKHFPKSNIETSRASNQNEWNPFIMYSNVIFGMYMLPHSIDGDNRLVHPWQELNIVTSGSSKFVMDTGAIDVEEGSIVFVEEGIGHYFDALKEDLDILILWEQRNVSHEGH